MRKILFRGKRKNGEWVEGYLVKMFGVLGIIPTDDDGLFNPVIPETVGQYTGLDDVNGKMIFEGDVMKFATGQIGCIEWFGNAFTLKHANKKYGNSYGYRYDTAEVIGNIHDNPELMEEII